MVVERSDALVFFGATGDLAFKAIFPALAALAADGRLAMPIVAVGRKPLPIEELRARVKKSLAASDAKVSKDAFERFAELLAYVEVDFDEAATFSRIRKAIGDAEHPLHYVALPPEVFENVATNLAKAGLASGARIVLEKPFGHDLASAKALSTAIHASFPEEAIFRIDHFLGKESVENIAYFRAANPLFEKSLQHDQVESVQITMAETFGVKGRGKFYDGVGALRDVVQNHMLELVTCLAMDLPVKLGGAELRAERSKLLARVHPVSANDIVRGQARGYAAEDGIPKDSKTETFAALRITIDSPRWRDVPFFIRAGKYLPVTATEALIRWKQPEGKSFDEPSLPAPNHLRLRIGPEPAIALGANVKTNGAAMVGAPTELVLCRPEADPMTAYERLLGDAIDGDPALFARKDEVEAAWRVVEPTLGDVTPVHLYETGSWGPPEAARISPKGGWHDPR